MHQIWGRADDESLVCIRLPDDHPAEPGPWWPPVGLTACVPPPDDTASTAGTSGSSTRHDFTLDPADPHSADRLESDLGLHVAERLDRLVAVHAAVLVRNGVMVIVPGESMVGKTTLCAAALTSYIEVWSDEYALVDPDTGQVAGWPRRLRVRTPHGGAERVPITTVDPTAALIPTLVPSLVAQIRFDPGLSPDSPLQVNPLQESEIVLALLANTVCAQSRPEFAFRGALAVASRTTGVTGTRGDASAALDALFTLAAGQTN